MPHSAFNEATLGPVLTSFGGSTKRNLLLISAFHIKFKIYLFYSIYTTVNNVEFYYYYHYTLYIMTTTYVINSWFSRGHREILILLHSHRILLYIKVFHFRNKFLEFLPVKSLRLCIICMHTVYYFYVYHLLEICKTNNDL